MAGGADPFFGEYEISYRGFIARLGWLMKRKSWGLVAGALGGGKETVKELAEALSVFFRLYRDEELRSAGSVAVVEAGAGRYARLSVLVASQMRGAVAVATDIVESPRPEVVQLSKVLEGRLVLRYGIDAFSPAFDELLREVRAWADKMVVACIHCCKTLGPRVVDAAMGAGAERAILVPCCPDPRWALRETGIDARTYPLWVKALADYFEARGYGARIETDPAMLTPANAIITVEKK